MAFKKERYKGANIIVTDARKNGIRFVVSYIRINGHKIKFNMDKCTQQQALVNVKQFIDDIKNTKILPPNICCYECNIELTKNNLYPYSYILDGKKRRYFCQNCERLNMMINEKEFKKELEWNKKQGQGGAIIEGGKIKWMKKKKSNG